MSAIAVLGAGNIGATLARAWAAARHDVVIGSRDPHAAAVRDLAASIGARVASHGAAVQGVDVVLLALPGGAVTPVLRSVGSALDGKVVIDATNSLGGPEMNAIASITHHAPHAVPVRAFNSLGWENFADPVFDGTVADLFWCGPDGHGVALVERLVADVGLRPVRVGGLDQLHVVDALASLWFALALGQGLGRHLAFKVLTRPPGTP
jgi:predicted dinucleotide-binding enzyme